MLTDEQKELRNIEVALYQKFKKRQCDLFYFDGDILGYDEMIENLAIQAQQYLWDEDLTWWHQMDQIPEIQWDKWIDEYEIPEESCSCSRGCKYCLGTEW
jgi:hypothetical protein